MPGAAASDTKTPGPIYEINHAVGKQLSSEKDNAPIFTFGSSKRDHVGKVSACRRAWARRTDPTSSVRSPRASNGAWGEGAGRLRCGPFQPRARRSFHARARVLCAPPRAALTPWFCVCAARRPRGRGHVGRGRSPRARRVLRL